MRHITLYILCLSVFAIFGCKDKQEEGIKLSNEATLLSSKEEYSEAILKYKAALKLLKAKNAAVGIIYSNLGICFQQKKDFDSCSYYFEKAYKFYKPGSFEHHTFKGEYLISKDLLSEAFIEFTKANSLKKDLNTLVNLASIHAGDFYLDEKPTEPNYIDYKKAEAFLLEAKNIDASENVMSKLGEIYLLTEKFQEAENIFRELFDSQPGKEIYRYNQGLAMFYKSKGSENEGYNLMEEAAKRDDECRELFKIIQDEQEGTEP